MMNDDDRKRLQGNRTVLVRDLRTQDICDRLYESGVLTDEDMEYINIEERRITPQDSVRRLLKMLPKRGEKAFFLFMEALNDDYLELRHQIEDTDPAGITLAEDHTDNDAKLKLLQEQLHFQQKMSMEFLDNIKALNKKVEAHEETTKTLEDKLENKYLELEGAMSNIGISEKEVVLCLTDYFKTPRFQDCNDGGAMSVLKRLSQEMPDSAPDFTETVCRSVGIDTAQFIANGYHYNKPAPNIYASTMRRVAMEVSKKYGDTFSEFLDTLDLDEITGYQTLFKVAEEMFQSDHVVNWGRVVVIYAFLGWVSKVYVENGVDDMPDIVGDFVGYYISRNHRQWLEENGGWDGFLEFFKDDRSRRNSRWGEMLYAGASAVGLLALVYAATKRT